MPLSLMTRSEPRPRMNSGSSRDRAKRTMARSSKRLWISAKRSAGPPTRIVVKRANGLVARRLDADPALDVRAEPGQVHRQVGGGPSSITRTPETFARWWPGWELRPLRERQDELGNGRGRPGRPNAARRGRIVVEDAAILEQRQPRSSACRVEVLVGHDPRRSGLGQRACVPRLVGRRVRIWDDDHRQSERAGLGERRRSGSADEQVRGEERIGHLGTQEGIRPVSRASLRGQRLAPLERLGIGRPRPSCAARTTSRRAPAAPRRRRD